MTGRPGALLALLLAWAAVPAAAQPRPAREVRGVWLTNVHSRVLESRERIAEAMDFLAGAGFNVVFPVVWNDGYTVYPSETLRREFGVALDPRYEGRDPLAEVVFEAHRAGLEVVPWFEFGFAASLRKDGGHILARRPGWAARDRQGRLLSKNGFEWMNALHPEVQDFVSSLVLEVARGYDVDGVQGDDRLPALPSEGGYDAWTAARYREETGRAPPDDPRDPDWIAWRAGRLTDYLRRLRTDVRAVDTTLVLSLSPSWYDWSLREYLQDSRAWTREGLYEAIHPQAYRYSLAGFTAIVDDLVTNQFDAAERERLAPGILIRVDDWQIAPDTLLAAIAYDRAKGVQGEVLFFYEGLRAGGDAVGDALRTGPYRERALLPWREGRAWRPPAGALRQEPPPRDAGAAGPGIAPGTRRSVYAATVQEAGDYLVYARGVSPGTAVATPGSAPCGVG
ncbi:MAG: hypothetical protein FIA95_06770, partial [Gemmatimonadetes bacterium]|nr:hypothetical protein [Gemmatimonadota bacterium]